MPVQMAQPRVGRGGHLAVYVVAASGSSSSGITARQRGQVCTDTVSIHCSMHSTWKRCPQLSVVTLSLQRERGCSHKARNAERCACGTKVNCCARDAVPPKH